MKEKHKFDLEDRLVKFAGNTILFTSKLPKDDAGKYFTNQVIRSSSSAALNYGEAQGTTTIKDFIHKMSLVVKELKETRVSFKILDHIKYGLENQRIYLAKECEELIAISTTMILNKKKKNQ